MPARVERSVRFLADGVDHVVGEIPGLDPDGRRCSPAAWFVRGCSRSLGDVLRGERGPRRAAAGNRLDGPYLGSPRAGRRVAGDGPRQPPAGGDGVGSTLARYANEHHVRLVLVRRHGRSVITGPSRVFVAHVRETGSWLARTEVTDAGQLRSLAFAEFARGRPTGVEPVSAPMFCVCTHGAHDQCCATRGRPVAAAVADRFPEETWEVSHIGGDRFAANVVCFPDGYYFGRVPAYDAAAVAAEYVQRRLRLSYLRGRSCYPTVVQAADVFARTELNLVDVDAVRLVQRSTAADVTVVTFATTGGERDRPAAGDPRGRAASAYLRCRPVEPAGRVLPARRRHRSRTGCLTTNPGPGMVTESNICSIELRAR